MGDVLAAVHTEGKQATAAPEAEQENDETDDPCATTCFDISAGGYAGLAVWTRHAHRESPQHCRHDPTTVTEYTQIQNEIRDIVLHCNSWRWIRHRSCWSVRVGLRLGIRLCGWHISRWRRLRHASQAVSSQILLSILYYFVQHYAENARRLFDV